MKYFTDEEKKLAQQKRSKEHYEKHKNDPVYKEKRRIIANRFYEKHKEKLTQKANDYYQNNEDYRTNKLEKTKQKYIENPELRALQNEKCKMRYWEKKARFLEFEKMLLDKNIVQIDFK